MASPVKNRPSSVGIPNEARAIRNWKRGCNVKLLMHEISNDPTHKLYWVRQGRNDIFNARI